MPVNAVVTEFKCPQCLARLEPSGDLESICPACDWRGEVWLFRPLLRQVQQSETALPEDAACAHHPAKRAVAVCAATGDYICALCSIELDGKTYSAEYLGAGGQKKLAKAFDRYLQRPDSQIVTIFALSWLCSCVGVVGVPLAIWKFVAMIKQRNADPLYRRLVGPVRVTVLGIILGFWGLAFLLGAGFLLLSMIVNMAGR